MQILNLNWNRQTVAHTQICSPSLRSCFSSNKKVKSSLYLNETFARKFLQTKTHSNMPMKRVLSDPMEFIRKSVHWIQGHDTIDTCFVLNYGYDAPLPWPQV